MIVGINQPLESQEQKSCRTYQWTEYMRRISLDQRFWFQVYIV